MERPVNCGPIPEVQERALSMFRLTEDPSSAGFILNDGRMIALDSDNEHEYYTEQLFPRVSDHVSAFLETGAIRFRKSRTYPACYAQFAVAPTPKQLAKLREVCGGANSLGIDCIALGNDEGKKIMVNINNPSAKDVSAAIGGILRIVRITRALAADDKRV